MDIRDPKSLRSAADEALAVGRKPKQVILWYAGLITLMALVVMVVDLVVGQELDQATGLSNLGLNAVLSTVQEVLPGAQMLVQMCLNLGYLYAMLRVGRKLYADKNDLKEGLHRFGPMLRMFLLQFLLFMAVATVLMYPVSMIFALTPLSNSLMELAEPLMNLDPNAWANDPVLIDRLLDAMLPLIIVYLVLYVAVIVPISFHFRMASYLLVDQPRCGAFAALKGSFKMMRRNCLKLLKVDLHLWWYHVLVFLAGLVAYGDWILGWLGIPLPVSADAAFYIFQIAYLGAMFAVYYFFRNRAELTYIMAYECLRPKEEKNNSIVLGNIFQM